MAVTKEAVEARGPAKYSGADWLQAHLKTNLSPIGAAAADILGQVFRGIYRLNKHDIQASTWTDSHFAEVRIGWRGLSTFDESSLTELVILCHDRAVRLDINARTFKHLTLLFHQRERTGGISRRHPTMEEAVIIARQRIGLGIAADAASGAVDD